MPSDLLADLALVPHDSTAGPPSRCRGPDNMTMVATFHRDTSAVSTSSVASAFAMVAEYLQQGLGLPLFYSVSAQRLFWAFDAYSKAPVPDVLSDAAELSARQRRMAFLQARDRAISDAGILEDVPAPGGPEGARAKRVIDHVKAFDVTMPVRRPRLMNPASPEERRLMLGNEQQMADLVLYKEKSNGMVNAFLLQRAYLAPAPTLEKGLQDFFRSRGFDVACKRKPARQVTSAEPPCVMLTPSMRGVVLAGLSGPADSEAVWGLICVPETVRPFRQSLADKLRTTRIAAGRPPDEAQDIDPSLPEEVRADIARKLERLRQLDESIVVVEDPQASLPASLDRGAHFVRLAAMAQWESLTLSRPVVGNNWGND
ncbi:MAG TPA: hypothetical protein VMZ31_19510 [Phycisphaerae bacterium]|nr:hypothetical protein [Phycisphaerae bacterium]